MKWWVLVVTVAALGGGCIRATNGFHCATDSDCGGTGTCQGIGFCSFPDTACPGGLRYGDQSGSVANQCVEVDAGVDARPDAHTVVPPVFVMPATVASDVGTSGVSFSLAVPPGEDRFLIVSAELSGDMTEMPAVAFVTYGTMALTRIDSVSTLPVTDVARIEQWSLLAPPVGTDTITITLTSVAPTIHGNAMLFTGVNQTTPIRGIADGNGEAETGAIVIASEPNDLVESTVGHGGGIIAPGLGGEIAFLDDGDSHYSFNNAAGSLSPGAAPDVTVAWLFADVDNWQGIAASLEPSP